MHDLTTHLCFNANFRANISQKYHGLTTVLNRPVIGPLLLSILRKLTFFFEPIG